MRAKTWNYCLKPTSEFPVSQGIYKWVATAVQHSQRGGDDVITVGEWAQAVCKG